MKFKPAHDFFSYFLGRVLICFLPALFLLIYKKVFSDFDYFVEGLSCCPRSFIVQPNVSSLFLVPKFFF